MTTPIITIRIPKQWKSTLWVLLTGGAVVGLSYWLWCRRQSRHHKRAPSTDEVMADLQSFPKLSRLPGVHRAPSQSSRNSTLNERRSAASLTRRTLNQPVPTGHDSDLDDASTSSVIDWGRLGLRTLAGVVDHLETLMAKIRRCEDLVQVDASSNSGQLINELRLLLEQAYQLREQYKRNRHHKRAPSTDEVMADLQSFPKLSRLPGVHRAPSQSSRNSTLNERRSAASLTRRTLNQPVPTGHDSDLDDASTSSVIDWGRLGLRTLAGVVDHLETLMAKIRRCEDLVQVDASSNSGQLINELRLLLEQAYQLREQYKR
ncbi:Protein FAM73B, partial [Fasciolopsis buskii]